MDLFPNRDHPELRKLFAKLKPTGKDAWPIFIYKLGVYHIKRAGLVLSGSLKPSPGEIITWSAIGAFIGNLIWNFLSELFKWGLKQIPQIKKRTVGGKVEQILDTLSELSSRIRQMSETLQEQSETLERIRGALEKKTL